MYQKTREALEQARGELWRQYGGDECLVNQLRIEGVCKLIDDALAVEANPSKRPAPQTEGEGVDIEVGAQAIHKAGPIAWNRDASELERRYAKACAKAWNLKIKEQNPC